MRPRAPAVCPRPGCPQDQPCPTHTPKPWEQSNRRSELPPDWEHRRARVLRRDGHRCVQCGAPANEVDHRDDPMDHAYTNLQTLCHPCHATKTKAEAAAGRRRG